MSRLRVAVIGVGHLGRHHARILGGMSGVELVGVADARIEQARAVAEPLGTQAHHDYRALLDQVDAVSIAVPTSLHVEVACAFLSRGISTLVEKPLASSAEDAARIVELADAKRALLQVGHIERFNPALQAVLDAGWNPKYVAAERLGLYTFRSTDIGVVHDLMIHDIDLLLALVPSAVRSVAAVGVSIFGTHEDVANARIEFEDGCVANLTASRASYQALRKMRIWSSEGYASLDFAGRHATIVRPSDRLKQGELDVEGVDLTQPNLVREHLFGKVLRVDQVPPTVNREPLALELEEFVQAATEGQRPRVTGVEALRAMRLADMILRSMERHQWEGRPEGPVGPKRIHNGGGEPNSGLPRPKSWRYRLSRRGTPPST